jgi:hypothetical protein
MMATVGEGQLLCSGYTLVALRERARSGIIYQMRPGTIP